MLFCLKGVPCKGPFLYGDPQASPGSHNKTMRDLWVCNPPCLIVILGRILEWTLLVLQSWSHNQRLYLPGRYHRVCKGHLVPLGERAELKGLNFCVANFILDTVTFCHEWVLGASEVISGVTAREVRPKEIWLTVSPTDLVWPYKAAAIEWCDHLGTSKLLFISLQNTRFPGNPFGFLID